MQGTMCLFPIIFLPDAIGFLQFQRGFLIQKQSAPPVNLPWNPKKFATVACSLALTLGIGSISVYAAWKYLTPDRIAEEIGET